MVVAPPLQLDLLWNGTRGRAHDVAAWVYTYNRRAYT